ncbi:peroxisomal membrane anchor protein conserved region-domain-containing protein [Kockovaella imperatae]|uniref:Peroxisomal membrane protein PEX14 n=1 Tax=Kockovaella imperatae TaxID=4999 RepID=A0A1Y1US54_9TREE|nr:peroxisomal membrane anchor protein conserved region-domain-containing protein [Kockovaella imperatae]ORX40858.1 peroxisomal membrane anchor protein conserved region-domain-containing protein [Kockovaella imperatae]
MSSGSSNNRQDLIQNAILFLNDPKVQSSTLASKITFLETKGLNESEIQEALARAPSEESSGQNGASSSSASTFRPYGYTNHNQRYGGPPYEYSTMPLPPRRDWRDIFIVAVISGGFAYGLTALARKYLLPHLQPPSTTSFQQTSQDLTSSYDEAAQLLRELSDQTNQLQTSLENDRERIDKVVDDVELAVKSVKDGEERWREEMRDMRGEVDSLKDLVPRGKPWFIHNTHTVASPLLSLLTQSQVMEKHASNQSSALSELQNELRSLKTLLQSRQLQSSTDANGGISSPNGTSNGSPISSTRAAANALLGPSKRGIPAWQLASSSSTTNGDRTQEGSAGSASESSSLAASGVLDRSEVNGESKETQ